jgi:hypothetical protein
MTVVPRDRGEPVWHTSTVHYPGSFHVRQSFLLPFNDYDYLTQCSAWYFVGLPWEHPQLMRLFLKQPREHHPIVCGTNMCGQGLSIHVSDWFQRQMGDQSLDDVPLGCVRTVQHPAVGAPIEVVQNIDS